MGRGWEIGERKGGRIRCGKRHERAQRASRRNTNLQWPEVGGVEESLGNPRDQGWGGSLKSMQVALV